MLKPIEKTKVYEAAVEQIRAAIESGEWPPGSQLPAERELAEQLNIGRTSVREALRVLEVMGLVEIRPGQGTYVTVNPNHSQPIELLQSMLQEDVHVVELLEIRELLEPQIACMAAQSATAEDIEALSAILERMTDSLAAGESGVEENIEFHLALTRAAGNRVLIQFHQLFFELSRDSIERFFQVPGRAEESLQGHREILETVRQRKPQEAQQKMLAHLRTRFAAPQPAEQRAGREDSHPLTAGGVL
jgi:GntR family transcriptional repressor for pyruvate dehydrogenase complex